MKSEISKLADHLHRKIAMIIFYIRMLILTHPPDTNINTFKQILSAYTCNHHYYVWVNKHDKQKWMSCIYAHANSVTIQI